MQKFRRVFEGIAKAGQSTDLNDFYTELFITERVSREVNKEHEVRLIETASRKPAKEETPIKLEDIFKPLPGQDQPSRTIMTTGVAGIGKTILTHKFTLDWAEGKSNQDIHFTLPFTFRELNLLKVKKFSLVELLHHFFIQTKGIRRYDLFQVVFILDGLDECRLPLDFKNNPIWTDVSKSTSVDVLLTNLIRGDLLPSARIWITTRPAAANQIPAECVDMVTEVRGFTDPQKEEYFRKRFREETLASTIISHIKTSRSLHIMCHIPRVQQYGVEVTLDPDTAHPQLILSDDGKQVHDGGVGKELPDNPKRFTRHLNVLMRQSFSSGRFYFEVQVKDKTTWWLGVARESVSRKELFTSRTPENGFWTLYLLKDKLVFNDNPDVRLPVRAELQKVGVFVDYDAGLVSFYDVEARAHIYSATGCTFSEPLYPFFCPGSHDGGRNSTPLIISPVNQTD
ncbi:hypothetical protein NHX12_016386 [Muraenolepis orangiensis]|uniref:B30.2/SPRY domain-containing protein n=1 Tax=Muraenolepis orangiensis TaxID=630683 RepID=A0A9Q0D4R1_9TELE|nr:hypothetical protein NHX12_016386 [Muraenolepis orangiensis]